MSRNVLILSKRYSSDSQILYNAAINNSWRVWRFTSRDIPAWVRESDVSIYCETAFADYLASELNIQLLSPSNYLLAKLPFDFVKRNIEYTTYKNFKKPSVKKFIKPADYKYFPAGIYGEGDEIPGLSYCQDDDPFLISDIVKFINEYRLFVMNDEISTGSIYVSDSEFVGDKEIDSNLNSNLLVFANKVVISLKGSMPTSYVLDIGQLDSGDYAVIEFNPTWASGFYGSDPSKVLFCIQSSCKIIT
jgi:hypothetical protein